MLDFHLSGGYSMTANECCSMSTGSVNKPLSGSPYQCKIMDNKFGDKSTLSNHWGLGLITGPMWLFFYCNILLTWQIYLDTSATKFLDPEARLFTYSQYSRPRLFMFQCCVVSIEENDLLYIDGPWELNNRTVYEVWSILDKKKKLKLCMVFSHTRTYWI